MPDRVARMIKTESPSNKSRGIITAVAALLERDAKVDVAYLCHKSVVQISRLAGEGNHFCAYRNIQMLLSRDPPPIYTITELQDMIEKAWDQGINPHGRVETGGIKGTRKHIGTSEVSFALFLVSYVPYYAVRGSHSAHKRAVSSVISQSQHTVRSRDIQFRGRMESPSRLSGGLFCRGGGRQPFNDRSYPHDRTSTDILAKTLTLPFHHRDRARPERSTSTASL